MGQMPPDMLVIYFLSVALTGGFGSWFIHKLEQIIDEKIELEKQKDI